MSIGQWGPRKDLPGRGATPARGDPGSDRTRSRPPAETVPARRRRRIRRRAVAQADAGGVQRLLARHRHRGGDRPPGRHGGCLSMHGPAGGECAGSRDRVSHCGAARAGVEGPHGSPRHPGAETMCAHAQPRAARSRHSPTARPYPRQTFSTSVAVTIRRAAGAHGVPWHTRVLSDAPRPEVR